MKKDTKIRISGAPRANSANATLDFWPPNKSFIFTVWHWPERPAVPKCFLASWTIFLEMRLSRKIKEWKKPYHTKNCFIFNLCHFAAMTIGWWNKKMEQKRKKQTWGSTLNLVTRYSMGDCSPFKASLACWSNQPIRSWRCLRTSPWCWNPNFKLW